MIELHALGPVRNARGAGALMPYAVRPSEIRSVMDAGPYRTIVFTDGTAQDVDESYELIMGKIGISGA